MEEVFEYRETSGTEGRRSLNGVPDAASPEGAHASAETQADRPQVQSTQTVDAPGEEKEEPVRLPRLTSMRRGQRLLRKPSPRPKLTPQQRLLMLDTWQRSGLSASEFATLVGVSKHTLYKWKERFQEEGPSGLMDTPRSSKSRKHLSELTKRAILMLKKANPEYGCERISDMLIRGPGLQASPSTVAKILHEEGYELEGVPTRPHRHKVKRFERAKPNELWQTDIFTFTLKRQNRRVYLVAFMDDHSRYLVGYSLYGSQTSALVIEVLRAAISSYGPPKEILTDNGTQYATWRGKSAFTKELEKRGIKQIVASPRRPQTLGKIERFWGTLWRECIETAIFLDLEDARKRIGLFIDHYNFQRTHQGIGGLVPADRFYEAAQEVLRTLKARVEANALQLAKNGLPKRPFYLTGQVGGKAFSVHAEGERVFLTHKDGVRQEVDLKASVEKELALVEPEPDENTHKLPLPLCPNELLTSSREESQDPPPPGVSPLDEGLESIEKSMNNPYNRKEVSHDQKKAGQEA